MAMPAEFVTCDPVAGPSIMVVDSDRRTRSALTRIIEASHAHASVVEVSDVATALNKARTTQFDLILVDMRLPDLASSCELIRRIDVNHVVALGVRQDDARHAQAAGARDFVWKTNSSELFLQAVRNSLITPLATPEPSTHLELRLDDT
ncbi:response regulator [Rhodococcus sp. IC4_135]|uniref:response regulator n=1 Tax=Rhodococcus sp. IC4_135 TaxID=2715537 RepID=UPI00141FFFF3|nr:response regulator [Rhodococcus sp. IC4_135]